MALPNTDAKLGVPYNVQPSGNTSLASNRTDAGEIDDRFRVVAAEMAKLGEKAAENDSYLNDRETTITRSPTREINVSFDQAARKGQFVFPVDIQEHDGVEYPTVRATPLASNITTDCIGIVPEDTEVGALAPIQTRGILTDILWPTDLTPPEAKQQAVIEYDADRGWMLADPITYADNILQPGQKLIGMYRSYDAGPPARYSLILTGFSQSNLNAPPAVVHQVIANGVQRARIANNAANLERYHNIIEAAITPRHSRGVKIDMVAYLRFFGAGSQNPTQSAGVVLYELQRGETSLFGHPIERSSTFRTYNAVRDPMATASIPAHNDWFPWHFSWIDTEATIGERNVYRMRYRNASYDTIILPGTFMRLEEIEFTS